MNRVSVWDRRHSPNLSFVRRSRYSESLMGALETYLSSVRDTKVSGEGVSELSYYPALHALLEEVGAGLKPKVRCFMNLKNRGAGLPDGGLFTADQVRGSRAAKSAAVALAREITINAPNARVERPAASASSARPATRTTRTRSQAAWTLMISLLDEGGGTGCPASRNDSMCSATPSRMSFMTSRRARRPAGAVGSGNCSQTTSITIFPFARFSSIKV